MERYNDLHISGVGKQSGGCFGSVQISGSGKLLGPVECNSFHVSGAAKVEGGGLTVHGPVACSGAAKVEGPLYAKSARVSGALSTEAEAVIEGMTEVSGSFKSEGALRVDSMKVSGVCKAEAGIRGNEITVSGVLKTPADLQAETLRSSGALSIDGLLNAERVEIELNGENNVHSIGGGSVLVRRKSAGFSLFGLQKRARLNVELIEADEIDLEYTNAQTVRGVNVHVGNECVIDRVEYSGTLTTDAYTTIGERVKV